MGNLGYYETDATFNLGLLVKSIEKGLLDINDPLLLRVLEQSFGKPITPRNKPDPTRMDPDYLMQRMSASINNQTSVPKGNVVVSQEGKNVSMPVIKTDLPGWMSRKLSKEEMYKMAVEETDKRIMGSHILQNKDFSVDLRLAIEKWATPELFNYLSMKGPRAEAELRAAMYPLNVGFCHRIFEADGRNWIVPYITVCYPNSRIVDANKGEEDIRECNTSYSFYCNKWNEVRFCYTINFYERSFWCRKYHTFLAINSNCCLSHNFVVVYLVTNLALTDISLPFLSC